MRTDIRWAMAMLTMLALGCGSTVDRPVPGPIEGAETTTPPMEPPVRSPSPTSTTTSSSQPPSATDGSDVAACYDGNCEVVLSAPTDISVDPEFGVTAITVVTIEPDGVAVQADGPGVSLSGGAGPGGAITLNGVTIRVLAINDASAVLNFSA